MSRRRAAQGYEASRAPFSLSTHRARDATWQVAALYLGVRHINRRIVKTLTLENGGLKLGVETVGMVAPDRFEVPRSQALVSTTPETGFHTLTWNQSRVAHKASAPSIFYIDADGVDAALFDRLNNK